MMKSEFPSTYRKWLITAERRHGGMTVTSDTFELWLDAEDAEDAREQGHGLLPRNWHAVSAELG